MDYINFLNKDTGVDRNLYFDIDDMDLSWTVTELFKMKFDDEITLARESWKLFHKLIWPQRIKELKSRVDYGYRACVIRGIHFNIYPIDIAKKILLGFSYCIWQPTYTDEVTKTVIWDIQPRQNLTVTNTTFSQVAWEAEFHTDTQYYPNPEKYLILACHTKAVSWWNSLLLDWRKLVADIQSLDEELYGKLMNLNFPFRVPSVFTRWWTDSCIELYIAKIFSDTIPIRYRKETIEKWLKFLPYEERLRLEQALSSFEEYLSEEYRVLELTLENNEILLCNNHELLHWRTDFDDLNRLLYRIRIQ